MTTMTADDLADSISRGEKWKVIGCIGHDCEECQTRIAKDASHRSTAQKVDMKMVIDRAVVEQALHVAESAGYPVALIKALRAALTQQAEPDLSRCPQCNGPADNGFDRSIPPSPYLCTKCMAEPVKPVAWRDEVHRLHAENASFAAALASSCDEQRHQLWESGGIAGCERARVAERQRDALLEALKGMRRKYGEYACSVCDHADAVIKAVKDGK